MGGGISGYIIYERDYDFGQVVQKEVTEERYLIHHADRHDYDSIDKISMRLFRRMCNSKDYFLDKDTVNRVFSSLCENKCLDDSNKGILSTLVNKFKAEISVYDLINAVKANNSTVVQFLIEKKVNLNYCDYKGYTAFMIAVNNKHYSIACMLADARANLNIINNDGICGLTSLFHENDEFDYFKQLLTKYKNDIDINVKGKNGNTPLMIALLNKKIEYFNMLLSCGARLEEVNNNNETVLHVALQIYPTPNNQVIDKLLKNGSKIEAKTFAGNTALHLSCNNLETCKMIINNGANIEVKNNKSNTPLHEACKQNNLDVIKLLLSRGSNKNAQNDLKETPLIILINKSSNQLIKYLLDSGGVNLELVNYQNDTAVEIAHKNRKKDIVDILLYYGAKKTDKLFVEPLPEEDQSE